MRISLHSLSLLVDPLPFVPEQSLQWSWVGHREPSSALSRLVLAMAGTGFPLDLQQLVSQRTARDCDMRLL